MSEINRPTLADDWRGEYLIRATRYPRNQAPICAVPGCGARLDKRSTSGVCGKHQHVEPHCRCTRCERKD